MKHQHKWNYDLYRENTESYGFPCEECSAFINFRGEVCDEDVDPNPLDLAIIITIVVAILVVALA